jgi:hypothetical protein
MRRRPEALRRVAENATTQTFMEGYAPAGVKAPAAERKT